MESRSYAYLLSDIMKKKLITVGIKKIFGN